MKPKIYQGAPDPVATVLPSLPLVSCMMPTAGRAAYVAHSVGYFLSQDYPNKELIIAYNTDKDLPSGWANTPENYLPANIHLVRVSTKIIGAKRNEACRHTTGAIIAQWDDDDIYQSDRLSRQVKPILAGEAAITGLQHFVFYDAVTGKAWIPTPSLFSEIYVGDVHGGSLVYDRRVWDNIAQYPNVSLGEDAGFLRKALKQGVSLQPLNGINSFVYIRHSSNTWKFEAGNFLRYPGWEAIPTPEWAQPYLPFYDRLAVLKAAMPRQ